MLLQGSAVAIVIVTFVAAASVGASAIRSRASQGDAANAAQSDSAPVAATPVIDSSAPTPAVTQSATPQAPAAPKVEAPSAESPRPTATTAGALAPTILLGQSELAPDVIAVRSDSDVVVSFDKPMLRTRRPDKFEQFVRTTLGTIYGVPAADALSKIPYGAIAAQGDLLTELPTRGLRIPVNGAWVIRLYPETRPGYDGPLVIRYRVRVVPIGG